MSELPLRAPDFRTGTLLPPGRGNPLLPQGRGQRRPPGEGGAENLPSTGAERDCMCGRRRPSAALAGRGGPDRPERLPPGSEASGSRHPGAQGSLPPPLPAPLTWPGRPRGGGGGRMGGGAQRRGGPGGRGLGSIPPAPRPAPSPSNRARPRYPRAGSAGCCPRDSSSLRSPRPARPRLRTAPRRAARGPGAQRACA